MTSEVNSLEIQMRLISSFRVSSSFTRLDGGRFLCTSLRSLWKRKEDVKQRRQAKGPGGVWRLQLEERINLTQNGRLLSFSSSSSSACFIYFPFCSVFFLFIYTYSTFRLSSNIFIFFFYLFFSLGFGRNMKKALRLVYSLQSSHTDTRLHGNAPSFCHR